jgi:hypothetical protein
MVRRTSALLLAQSVAACVALIACGSPRAELGPMDPLHTDADGTSTDDAGSPGDAPASEVNALACGVMAPTSCPDPPVRYPDVEPIFRTRCVICHNNNGDGPWPLTDYQDIADWQDIIRGDLLDCSMPPADAGVPMTLDDKMAILTWIRCALPQ